MNERASGCTRPELNALLGEYVAGRLGDDRIEALELHLLGCAECYEEARLGAAVRKARPRRVAWRRPVVWLPPLAAAAAVIAFLLFPAGNPYAELGRVGDVPAFAPAPIRTTPARAAAPTDSGMVAYTRGEYRDAERLLARGDVNEPGTAFFLGVSRLVLRRADGAVEALRRAQVPPGNPFEPEAQFYLAKAFLQLGWPDSAVAQLRAAEGSATIGARATALRRALEQVGRTP
jgi:hypothetical protein